MYLDPKNLCPQITVPTIFRSIRQCNKTACHRFPLGGKYKYYSGYFKKELERLQSWIDEAVQEGAKIECGGTVEGNVLVPTVLTNVNRDSKVFRFEVFGPIVCIFPFETLDDAIKDANDSRYGLNSGVMTPSIERAFYAAERLETGGVVINDIPTYRIDNMPYGGWKDSGVGREGVKYAMNEMMEQKFISFKIRDE